MRYLLLFFCTIQLMATNLVKETSTENVWVEAYLNDDNDLSELLFSDKSRIQYEYNERRLIKITRLNSSGEEMYSHTYKWDGARLISQIGWFTTHYTYDPQGRIIGQNHPWYQETIEYDSTGRLARAGDRVYSYNDLGEIVSEESFFHAVYDTQHNLIELNNTDIRIDEQNQIIGEKYDIHGNLLREGFVYDEKNRLIEAGGKSYTYDGYGRRVRKDTTSYLYLGFDEIASFENGRCKTLKIPGIGGAVAIEIDGKPYAPVPDTQGIIRKLIDPITNSVYEEICSDIFGQGITDTIPYAYRGKRYDPETGLIYFGLRYYDPSQHRWISRDPLGAIDHEDLYQYVCNNPIIYWDLTGGSFWGYVGGLCEIAAGGAILAGGVGLEFLTCGGFTIGLGVTTSTGLALIGHGLTTTTYHAQDIKIPTLNNGYNSQLHKRHTPDQEAINDLVKEAGKKGVSHEDADALLDWAKEYDFPCRDDRGKDHWVGGEHIHIGPKHVPVRE